MVKTIILVRHGDVDNPDNVLYGRTLDMQLSTLGRSQITSVGKQIKRLGLSVRTIHTSTLTRAVQTSEILSNHLHATIVQNSGLIDVHIPALVGKSIQFRKEIHATGGDEYSGKWLKLGHESKKQVIGRMRSAFDTIFHNSAGDVPLVVSHGDPITLLLYHLYNPGKIIPVVNEILEAGYIVKKGHGVVLQIDENLVITEKTLLVPET